MLVLIFLLLNALLANANVPVCNGTVYFNPPQNISIPTWYPYNYTQAPPLFPMNYSCSYQVNVPRGMFARVYLTVIHNSPNGVVPVTVTDQLGRAESMTNGSSTFFFLPPYGSVQLSATSQNVQFGFTVIWNYLTTSFAYPLDVSQLDTQPTLLEMNTAQPYRVMADTRVSATVLRPYDFQEQYLRGIVIFDGPDWNSTCLGNAKQLLDGNTQYVSSGNAMTILFIGWEFYLTDLLLIVQDYEHTKGIRHFQTMKCTSSLSCGVVSLDASGGPGALQTYAELGAVSEVITGMEGSGKLDVYIGAVTDSKKNLIASYDVTSASSSLPQKFLGEFKTYVLTGGSANLTITRNAMAFEATTDFGRKGFISSAEYGISCRNQKSYSEVQSPRGQSAKFRYAITKADLLAFGKLQVRGRNGSSTVFRKEYNQSSLPLLKHYEEFDGDDLEVTYDSYQKSTGFLMEFSVEKRNSAGMVSTLICLIVGISLLI